MIPEDFNSLDYYNLNKEEIDHELDYSFGDLNQTLRTHYEEYGQVRKLDYKLEVPEDFSLQSLFEINPELVAEFSPLGQKIQLNKAAYLKAKKFKFPYKMVLPQDFSAEAYKKYNPDLENMSDKNAAKHYFSHGQAEGRIYKLALPADFCVKGYKRYNPDLQALTDVYAERHYCSAGINEGRIYKVDLPADFDPRMYSYMNPDLEGLPEAELEKHYSEHGKREKREYLDPLYDAQYFSARYGIAADQHGYSSYIDDVRKIKSKAVEDIIATLPTDEIDLLLVSHQTSFFGATHYLYSLFCYIKEIYPDKLVKIAEQYADEVLTAKYGLSAEDVIVYHNDPTVLWSITDKCRPKKILINSSSKIINPVLKHLDKHKMVLHSHEVKSHYQAVIKGFVPDFVVSEKIAAQWEDAAVQVQPPFIDAATIGLLDATERMTSISNEFGEIDLSKLTVGMCGDLSFRKNPALFSSMAEKFKDMNFVWIGGHDDFPAEAAQNLFHVKSVANPYGYFKVFDYFLLTSITDPCPYVVLENLYLNNNVIVFRDSIFTAHSCDTLRDIYTEYPGEVTEAKASEILHTLQGKGKRTESSQQGKQYILAKFSFPNKEFLARLI